MIQMGEYLGKVSETEKYQMMRSHSWTIYKNTHFNIFKTKLKNLKKSIKSGINQFSTLSMANAKLMNLQRAKQLELTHIKKDMQSMLISEEDFDEKIKN